MIYAMTGFYYGSASDPGEATIANWEGATPDGTGAQEVEAALNNHYGGIGSWQMVRGESKSQYPANVEVDIYNYRESVITRVFYVSSDILEHQ